MLTDDDKLYIEQVALRAAGEVIKAAPTTGLLTQPALRPATVVAKALPGASTQVIFVGDAAPSAAQNISGATYSTGAKVMVIVSAQGGAFILGPVPPDGSAVELTADGPIELVMPPGASHVRLIASLRSATAVVSDNIWIRVNGVATAVYFDSGYSHNGATPTAYAQENTLRGFYAGTCHGDSAPAARFSPLDVLFNNPDSTTATKEGLVHAGRGGLQPYTIDFLETITTPIANITLLNGATPSPNWKSGSTAQLIVT